jgi:hypothetical protein
MQTTKGTETCSCRMTRSRSASTLNGDWTGFNSERSSLPEGRYSTITLSVPPRPNVSGWYISSAFGGGTTNTPGVVARATYE